MTNDITANWPFRKIVPTDDEAISDFISVFEDELDRLDNTINTLQTERFVDTATGTQLDLLAAEVGITRETNENDDTLRLRVLLRKAAANSDGSLPDIARLLQIVFGDDKDKVTLSAVTDEPVLKVTVPSALLDSTPISTTRLETILEDALPASDGLVILTDETFRLGKSGDQGLGSGKLL